MIGSRDVLFVGRGASILSWYRTGSAALNSGCDWVGMLGEPPDLRIVGALKRGSQGSVNFEKYKIIVIQQPQGIKWLHEIIRLKKLGIIVLYEIDDYLHGVREIKYHKAAEYYDKKVLANHEICMRAANGLIVSTDWLAEKYAKFNRNIWVCQNAIDRRRYEPFSPPLRRTVNIGWAGGEGHVEAVKSWLPAVKQILYDYPQTRFISVGLPVAKLLADTGRAVALPYVPIENFPGVLTNFDIAIGPAQENDFFAAKSDLRWLEVSGVAVPLVAHPYVYGHEILDGETGIIAGDVHQVYDELKKLVENQELREEIGFNARDYVFTHRSMEKKGAKQWQDAFVEIKNQMR